MIRLLKLYARNFCCYEQLELDLDAQGLVFISGDNQDTKAANSNGSGKTTMFKAITWALYGECVDGDKGDEVIRTEPGTLKPVAGGASVTVVLADSDEVYNVTRERKPGRPTLIVELIERGGVTGICDPFPGSRAELDAWIVSKLGLDFQAFKNTVLYGQNDINKFASPRTKDAERKSMLHRILRTDILEDCHTVAKEKAKALRKEHDEAIAKIVALRGRLDDIDLEGAQAQCDEWDTERAERVAAYIAEAKEINEAVAETRAGAPDTTALRKQADSLRASEAAAETAQTDASATATKLDKLKDEIHQLDTEGGRHQGHIDNYRGQVARFDVGQCPLCTTPADGEHIAKHIDGLRVKLKAAEAAKAAVEAKCRPLEKQRDRLKLKLKEQRRAAEPLPDVRRKLRAIEREIEAAAERDQEVKDEAARALALIERAKEARAEINPHTEALAKAKAKAKALKADVKAAEAARDGVASRLSLIEFWTRGFGPAGLPSFALDSAMGPLTERANHYLQTLADGDITVEFTTQRELKSGEARDEIQINWDINGLGAKAPSGGQWMRIALASDFALMDLCEAREGGRPNLLLIDEVLDGLDAEGVERVCHLLYKLRKRIGSIFVISHSPSMSEVFERELVVRMKDKVASLT